jgi:8-oxo-dGTP pyrophosphatase MutT (NUDIX family)
MENSFVVLENDVPITVTNRRLMCENTKFFIYFAHVMDRAGFEVPDYLVVAPKNAGMNLITGVAILPIVDGQVGLLRIFRPALQAYSWEIPHGFVDEEEDSKTSAARELLEESGLIAEPTLLSSLGFITPDSGVIAARVELFVAETGQINNRREGELGIREFRLFSFQTFEKMIQNSEIQDTFTLAAWCKYRLSKQLSPLRKATRRVES